MYLAASLPAPTKHPLPVLPAQTSGKAEQGTDISLTSNIDATIGRKELLRKTLSGLKNLDLTGQVTYDADSHYLAGGAYGDIRIGKCHVAGLRETKVAVKSLRVYLHENPDTIKLIEREIRVWSRVRHPNILPLIGYSIEDHGLPTLISEFMENGTVLKYVQAHPNCDIMHMALGLAAGVSYLHNAKVIHSDIKSDNVLVSMQGDPLICDFGISKLITVSHTMAGQCVQAQSSTTRGSARWMSPELLMPMGGQAVHSEQSDIWAFGMTIYEILTNERPYHQLVCDPQVITSIIYGQLPEKPRSSRNWSEWHDDLWSICEACWLQSPEARPSASQIVSILMALNNSTFYDNMKSNSGCDPLSVEITAQRKLHKQTATYDTFADMGIRGKKLEAKYNKCVIM